MKKVKPVKKLSLDPIKISHLSKLKGGNFATDLTSCQHSCWDCSVVCPTDICPSKFNKCDPPPFGQ